MKESNEEQRRCQLIRANGLILLALLILLVGSASSVIAHGGEDHGDSKPAVTAPDGMVSRTARLGDYEILLKYLSIEPDTPVLGRLFMTRFTTNEPVGDAVIEAEIESPTGMVTPVTVEKTDAAGSYVFKIPALTEGSYTFRATVRKSGMTDTATFSSVAVAHAEPAHASVAGSSWTQTAFMAFLFLIGTGLFAGLIYLAIRTIKNKPINEEAIAA